MTTDAILKRLANVRRNGREYSARCPAHNDQRNSLSVSTGDDGRTLLHCHAGCALDKVCGAIDINRTDLFADNGQEKRNSKAQRKIIATYDYRDESDELLSQCVRYSPKNFKQRRPDGQEGWIWNLKGTRRVLYRLRELLAHTDDVIYIVEGEKDADRLGALGLVATTCPMGAGKWEKVDDTPLHGRRVVIVPDADTTGRNHAHLVAKSLHGKAAEIRIVELPNLEEHGDISDFIDGYLAERNDDADPTDWLTELVDRTPVWEPASEMCSNSSTCPIGDSSANEAGPGELILTEMRIGERLVQRHGDELRFNQQYGWLIYTGSHWKRDEMGRVKSLAQKTVRSYRADLQHIKDAEQSRKMFNQLQSYECARRVRGILECADCNPAIRVATDDLDTDKFLFNCENGTLDLRSGEFRPHRQTDLISKCSGVRYDPSATAPRWATFLAEIFDGQRELVNFVQRAIGYSLTGHTREQCFFLLYGVGANGKSTKLNVALKMFGDYGTQSPAEAFMAKRNDSVRNDIARLAGVRFVSCIETEEYRRLAESLVKQLTGGDRVCARYLFHEFFEYTPQFKLWMAVNHKPEIRGTDHAIWRRIHLIPFNVKFEDEGEDKTLVDTLVGELSGIFNWAIAGCREWQTDGLNPPKAITDATAQYRSEQDTLAAFLADQCITGVGREAPSTAVLARYREWSGDKKISAKRLASRLREQGYTLSERRAQGRRAWLGFELIGDDA